MASIAGSIARNPAILAERYDITYVPLGAASYGGAERSLLELAAAQSRAGRRVLVCHEAALAATGFVTDAAALGLPVLPVDWAPERGAWAAASAASSLFRRLDTRIVHFNISWRAHMWVLPVLARLWGSARLVGTMRAMPEPVTDLPPRRYFGLVDGPPLRHLLELGLGRVWARTLHRTVSVNRDDYPPRLVAEYGFDRSRLQVIYNGVRIPERELDPDARSRARADLGIDARVFALGFVGRVSREKGLRHAVEALPKCEPRVEIWVAGDGPEIEPLKALAESLGVASRVHFLGYRADPAPLYAAVDALVVPSLWNEAFGRVVVEAMGHGTPVVCTAVGGMREIFSDGVEGWHVPKADAEAIARAVGRWVAEPGLLERMGAASRRLALARYSTTRVAEEYAALYASLLVR